MKMMIGTIILAVAAISMSASGLLAQVTPEPATPVASTGSTNATTPVSVRLPATRRFARGMFDPFSGFSSNDSVLVVPAGPIGIEDLAAANEDMTVMASILQKMIRQANLTAANQSQVFIGRFLGQSVPTAQNIYLQGYGALFMMNVDFPLSPGPETQEAPDKSVEPDVDPVWRAMRADIYDSQRPDDAPEEEAETYSAEKVESLKTTIITALKHAANIRGLAPSEVVVVTVTGGPVSNQITRIEALSGTDKYLAIDSRGATRVYKRGLPEDIKLCATVLTIRAKASDISSYAKGDLTLDDFRQKVQVLSCPYLGGGVSAGLTTSITTGVSTP